MNYGALIECKTFLTTIRLERFIFSNMNNLPLNPARENIDKNLISLFYPSIYRQEYPSYDSLKKEEAEKNFKIVDDQLKFRYNHELENLKNKQQFIKSKIGEERRLRQQVYHARNQSYSN